MELHEATLASMKGGSVDRAELQKCEEALMLEATKRTVDLERLETRERLVAQAEDDVAVREARALEEVDRRVAAACRTSSASSRRGWSGSRWKQRAGPPP